MRSDFKNTCLIIAMKEVVLDFVALAGPVTNDIFVFAGKERGKTGPDFSGVTIKMVDCEGNRVCMSSWRNGGSCKRG